jgi:hypothetical protein
MKKVFTNDDCYDRTEYYNEKGQLHRIDGPAVEYVDGEKQWWVNGKLHRDGDLPAVIKYEDGKLSYEGWFENGLEHRIGSPSSIFYTDGIKPNTFWRVNGENHRDGDLPAVERYSDYIFEWWINGKFHRETGPASCLIDEDGNVLDKCWYLNDEIYLTEEEWQEELIKLKLDRLKKLAE